MVIRVRAFGPLAQHFGSGRLEIQLPPGATLGDLWQAIGDGWGEQLPTEFWDGQAQRFRRGVLVMTHQAEVQDDNLRLADGQEVLLLVPVIGGS
jgi:molybdopterin converting factor small subunit